VAQAIRIAEKWNGLSEILSGNITDENLSALNDDWTIEERCRKAFSYWQLDDLDLNASMTTLSGGQKTKVLLAGIQIHNPEIVLLDEPTNHLDDVARNLLYRFIEETSCSLAVVSHDRTLLNSLETVCELSRHRIKSYGGNYDFYEAQKTLENAAIISSLEEKQKTLRKAKEIEREALERQQKQSARGKNQQKKEGMGKSMRDKMKNDAEKSAAHLKGVHADKIDVITQALNDIRKEIPICAQMKFGFDNSALHKGKILVTAKEINYVYHEKPVWGSTLDFQIVSGERIAIAGCNGSGKTTLIKLILGALEPSCGVIFRAFRPEPEQWDRMKQHVQAKTIYIDQDYSLINPAMSVYEQAQAFNNSALQEAEIKTRLSRFLFSNGFWDKPCAVLRGGEKMRLLLCCLTITTLSPDIIVLDEPTNNLDIQNIKILTDATNEYLGTLIVVSHDTCFLEQINITRVMSMPNNCIPSI
jgi:ATPase subunit of ABC transporter with duplicated ATPase domains